MDVTISITMPEYLYLFYKRVSEHLGERNTEEIIVSALFSHAGMVAEELILPYLDKDEPD